MARRIEVAGRRALLLAGLLVLGAVGLPGGSAMADPPRHRSGPAGVVEAQPTQQELDAQRATRRARAQVQAGTDAVSAAHAALRQASLEAGDALELSGETTRRLQLAEQDDARQRALLTQARLEETAQRATLGRWAREAYRDGTTVADNLTVITLLESGSTDDVGATLMWLQRVGRGKSRAVQAFRAAEAVQAAAAGRSQAAAASAASAAVAAASARADAEAAVARQRAQLATLENALALTHRRADAAAHRERALSARALGGGGDNRVIGAVGDCPGGAVQQYANGQIPLAALCPLAAAPQHRLRADAAYAFDRLSRAYAARFGAAPCITDSYRGYEQQLLLYAQKPGLAAVPGTSNHGWGTALDLCGGIQAFGAATHEWMLDNAPLFGWFHPAWAQAGGSRPEAWHWEYGGG